MTLTDVLRTPSIHMNDLNTLCCSQRHPVKYLSHIIQWQQKHCFYIRWLAYRVFDQDLYLYFLLFLTGFCNLCYGCMYELLSWVTCVMSDKQIHDHAISNNMGFALVWSDAYLPALEWCFSMVLCMPFCVHDLCTKLGDTFSYSCICIS